MEKKAKRWFKLCFGIFIAVILVIVASVIIVDPYFHFHEPFSFIKYRLKEERYINDGISRNFDYNAIVTGTSMTQNFKTSEVDEIFEVNSVKEPFAGAGYQELSQNLDRALKRNKNLKLVIWGIDYNGLLRDYDWTNYDDYPTYLYDDNWLNDVEYIFNKDVLYHGVLSDIQLTIRGENSTTFDEYSAWDKPLGLDYILNTYDRENTKPWESGELTPEYQEMVETTITRNIVELAKKYPDTRFVLFYTPYSICYWDELNLLGTLNRQIEAEKIATELILECDNISLYNFFDQYEIITNTDNYRDKEHYSADINSLILRWISEGTGLVTNDNYQLKLEEEIEFYGKYDYESIYR